MKRKQRPLLIKNKDVQRVLSLSDRQSRRVLQHVRQRFNKQAMQPVTFAEFCTYTGIDLKVVYEQLDC